jgi:Flp pilus assembly protein TadG
MAMSWALSKRVGKDRSGAAGVEFALVLPLLVVLAFGAIEIGWMIWQHAIITKGVRDGVRYLTRVPVTCTAAGTGGTFSATDKQTAINLVKAGDPAGTNLILRAYGSATFTVDVDCRDAASLGLAGGTYLPVVRMTAAVPFDDFTGGAANNYQSEFLGILGLGDVTFTVIHEEAHVGE